MIEFRGRTVSVTTTAEIQAWITDRKKRFPTAARVAEKKTQQETRKREADEKRKQRMEDQHKLQMQKKGDKKAIKKVKKDKIKKEPKIKDEEHKPADSLLTKEERQRKKLEKHLRKAEKLRSMLEQSDIKDDAPSGDKPVPEDSESSSLSDSSSDDSSSSGSDAAPDVEPSKGRSKPVKILAADRKASKDGRSNFTDMPCKYFIRDGHCRRKHCRFLHSIPKKAEKKTLFERVSILILETNFC
jgi:hypothetical protein